MAAKITEPCRHASQAVKKLGKPSRRAVHMELPLKGHETDVKTCSHKIVIAVSFAPVRREVVMESGSQSKSPALAYTHQNASLGPGQKPISRFFILIDVA